MDVDSFGRSMLISKESKLGENDDGFTKVINRKDKRKIYKQSTTILVLQE
jgi:hypothetical protein